MAQIDFIHFLPSVSWVIIMFLCFYYYILNKFIPIMYKIQRVRRQYILYLSSCLNNVLYRLLLIKGYNQNFLKKKNLLYVNISKIHSKFFKKIIVYKCI